MFNCITLKLLKLYHLIINLVFQLIIYLFLNYQGNDFLVYFFIYIYILFNFSFISNLKKIYSFSQQLTTLEWMNEWCIKHTPLHHSNNTFIYINP